MTGGRSRRVAAWAGVAVLVAVTAVLVGWYLQGGRWVRVETPSMGTEAPVGSLLWVRPVAFEELRAGDLITFRAPGSGQTYSHLVAEVHADGTVSTQGRISARDPWRVGADDVVGRVVLRWHGVGWIVVAAPVLGLGAALVFSVVRRLRDRESRLPVAVVGAAVVITVALTVHRPLTRAEQLAFEPVAGGARATYVSTGLLPLRLAEPGGDAVVLDDGEVGSVVSTVPETAAAGRRFEVSLGPAVPWGWWVALVGCCFVPALVSARPRSARGGAEPRLDR